MKQILKVILNQDRPAEATLNALFEDLYNRVVPDSFLQALRSGSLDRPHIDSTTVGIELNYAFAYVHSIPVANALLYVWRYRMSGAVKWSTWFSVENEAKIPNLYFETDYEIGVLAIGPLLIKSSWSYTTLVTTGTTPTPSQVTGVTLTNQSMYVDPVTGETMARTLVTWNDNATSEYVDEYEIVYVES